MRGRETPVGATVTVASSQLNGSDFWHWVGRAANVRRQPRGGSPPPNDARRLASCWAVATDTARESASWISQCSETLAQGVPWGIAERHPLGLAELSGALSRSWLRRPNEARTRVIRNDYASAQSRPRALASNPALRTGLRPTPRLALSRREDGWPRLIQRTSRSTLSSRRRLGCGIFETHFAVAPGRPELSNWACRWVLADLDAPKPTFAPPKSELAAATGLASPGWPSLLSYDQAWPPSWRTAPKGEERKLNARVLVT